MTKAKANQPRQANSAASGNESCAAHGTRASAMFRPEITPLQPSSTLPPPLAGNGYHRFSLERSV